MATREVFQQLIEPVTADQPCGENLEDTALLASFDEFRVFGQSSPVDAVPDWPEVKKRAEEALAKSKDLRLLAHLASALLRTDGFPAFTHTLTVASRWLDAYWAETYPLISEDAIFRRNALNCFADPVAIVDGLRRVPLVSSRQLGTFTLRDLEILSGQLQPRDGESPPDEGRMKAAFAAMPVEELQSLHQCAVDAVAAVKSIETRMQDAAGTEATPDLAPLSVTLAKLKRFVGTELTARGGGVEASDGVETGGVAPAGAPAAASALGPIKTREDAIRALDAVADFFRRNEPSSPVPLLVDRAKRLVSKDFLEVLAEVAPDALGQARAAGGLRQSD